MDSAKFALQAKFYSNDLMMQLGSDTRPLVLTNEDEFTQWQDSFINFIERQTNGENMMKSLSEGPFTCFMNNFEELKAKDNESLKAIFDRFCVVINDLRKIKVEKTDLETIMKFLNSLQSEWNKACHRLRNDVRIFTMQIQELYEILLTDESLVLEKKTKLDKKNKKAVDPVALLTKQLNEQALSDNDYTGSTDDDGEALQKAMILLSYHYKKKFQPRSGSNSSRFTSGPKVKVP
ncbi:hypothetical protein L6452_18237 [Arctium lappa]|uniref:Uncharacterized protein n=1 Tax=Arctium lappa TaxID=4217 RepID=A0ACB9C5K9_ARCLA|nr:hypothetical protein L6452_18237 [Arctium lappa]